MEIRNCPHCGYRYPINKYYKTLMFKFVWSSWKCDNCKKDITFSFNRRILIALGSSVLLFGFIVIKDSINIYWCVALIILLLIGSLLIFSFDTFKKATKKKQN